MLSIRQASRLSLCSETILMVKLHFKQYIDWLIDSFLFTLNSHQ